MNARIFELAACAKTTPEAWRNVAGGNTPGKLRSIGPHPGGVPDSFVLTSSTTSGVRSVFHTISGGVTPGYVPAALRADDQRTRYANRNHVNAGFERIRYFRPIGP